MGAAGVPRARPRPDRLPLHPARRDQGHRAPAPPVRRLRRVGGHGRPAAGRRARRRPGHPGLPGHGGRRERPPRRHRRQPHPREAEDQYPHARRGRGGPARAAAAALAGAGHRAHRRGRAGRGDAHVGPAAQAGPGPRRARAGRQARPDAPLTPDRHPAAFEMSGFSLDEISGLARRGPGYPGFPYDEPPARRPLPPARPRLRPALQPPRAPVPVPARRWRGRGAHLRGPRRVPARDGRGAPLPAAGAVRRPGRPRRPGARRWPGAAAGGGHRGRAGAAHHRRHRPARVHAGHPQPRRVPAVDLLLGRRRGGERARRQPVRAAEPLQRPVRHGRPGAPPPGRDRPPGGQWLPGRDRPAGGERPSRLPRPAGPVAGGRRLPGVRLVRARLRPVGHAAGGGAAALLYTAYTLVMMGLYGRDTWLAHGEVFSVLFRLIGAFAPVEIRAMDPRACERCRAHCAAGTAECVDCPACFRVSARREVALRPWAVGLLRLTGTGWDTVTFVVLALSSLAFDGLSATPAWASLQDRLGPGLEPLGGFGRMLLETAGLLGVTVLFLAVFAAVARLVERLGRLQRAGLEITTLFAFTLVPIALVYNAAHNYSYIVISSQGLVPLLADPLHRGAHLLPVAGYQVSFALANAQLVWYLQVVLIVVGHVLAVYVAHVRALLLAPRSRDAVRSQLPMLALMVVYTMSSLWILARPLTGRGPPVCRPAPSARPGGARPAGAARARAAAAPPPRRAAGAPGPRRPGRGPTGRTATW